MKLRGSHVQQQLQETAHFLWPNDLEDWPLQARECGQNPVLFSHIFYLLVQL